MAMFHVELLGMAMENNHVDYNCTSLHAIYLHDKYVLIIGYATKYKLVYKSHEMHRYIYYG